MAILTKPPQLTAIDTDLGTSVAVGLWKQARDLQNYVNACYPFGMVLMFDTSWSTTYGIGAPNPEFWHFLDGSVVTNPNSPLYNVVLPDFRGRFMRNTFTGEVVAAYAGSTTISLNHDHGGTGFTLDEESGPVHGDDQNGGRDTTAYHMHGIIPDLPSVSTMPTYREVQCYMRIL